MELQTNYIKVNNNYNLFIEGDEVIKAIENLASEYNDFCKPLREKIINGVYISYNEHRVIYILIIDRNLQTEPFPTILKSLIPLIAKRSNFFHKDEKIAEKSVRVIHGFINQLKKPEHFHLSVLKTVLAHGTGVTCLHPETFPLFAKGIINRQDLMQDIPLNNKTFNFQTRKFSNSFLMELIDSPLYTLDNILDNIDLFETDYAATFLKFKNIYPYMSSIIWTPEKINRQKLSFEDIIGNIEYFSSECINRYVITHCTAQEKETLLLLKEMM